jgi:hypothetical protein
MPRPLPADGRKVNLTVRVAPTRRSLMEAEAARAGVSLATLVESAYDRFMALSPASRDRVLTPRG